MAEQGMAGGFADYVRRPEGTYDPWAAAISGFVGGTRYAADRSAVQQERKFAEETRDEERAKRARELELQETLTTLDDPDWRPPEPGAPVKEKPKHIMMQGIPTPGQETAAATPTTPAAPVIPDYTSAAGINTALGAPIVTTPGEKTAPAKSSLAQAPYQVGQSPRETAAKAAELKTAREEAATNKDKSEDSRLRQLRWDGLNAELKQRAFTKARMYAEAEVMGQQAKKAFGDYARVGADRLLAAAKSGDASLVAKVRGQFPDLYDGLFSGEFMGTSWKWNEGLQAHEKVYRFLDDGKETLLTGDQMTGVIYSQLANPEAYDNALKHAEELRYKEIEARQKGSELKETAHYHTRYMNYLDATLQQTKLQTDAALREARAMENMAGAQFASQAQQVADNAIKDAQEIDWMSEFGFSTDSSGNRPNQMKVFRKGPDGKSQEYNVHQLTGQGGFDPQALALDATNIYVSTRIAGVPVTKQEAARLAVQRQSLEQVQPGKSGRRVVEDAGNYYELAQTPIGGANGGIQVNTIRVYPKSAQSKDGQGRPMFDADGNPIFSPKGQSAVRVIPVDTQGTMRAQLARGGMPGAAADVAGGGNNPAGLPVARGPGVGRTPAPVQPAPPPIATGGGRAPGLPTTAPGMGGVDLNKQ